MIKAQRVEIERRAPVEIDFGMNDAKGRAIGARIIVCVIDFVPAAEDCNWYFPREDGNMGRYFEYDPQALRDGAPYGACQCERRFRDEAAMNAAIAKYIADAKKRAAKKGA